MPIWRCDNAIIALLSCLEVWMIHFVHRMLSIHKRKEGRFYFLLFILSVPNIFSFSSSPELLLWKRIKNSIVFLTIQNGTLLHGLKPFLRCELVAGAQEFLFLYRVYEVLLKFAEIAMCKKTGIYFDF